MHNRPQKINYTKWGFLLGTPIAVIAAIAAVVAVPSVGCVTGLNQSACNAQLRDVELIAQSESGEALVGVKIQVIAQGAPEVQYTDNNGYAKVQVPSKGDVRINLTQEGYPVQDFIVNVENSQPTVRVIRFSESGQPDIKEFETRSGDPKIPNDPATPPAAALIQSSKGIFFQLKSCTQENVVLTCELLVTDKQQEREMYLYGSYSSKFSRIIDGQGNQYVANSVTFGGESRGSSVSQNLAQDIGLKAFITFEDAQVEGNELALVEIGASASDQGYFSIQFRDVPLSR